MEFKSNHYVYEGLEVSSYGHTPDDNLTFIGEGPDYIGMEIETATPINNLNDALSLSNNFVAVDEDVPIGTVINDYKHDCTIHHHGDETDVEWVTNPMSRQAWFEGYTSMKMFFKKLQRFGVRGDRSGCGIHLNINAKSFKSSDAVERFYLFFRDYTNFVFNVARRMSNTWCQSIDHYMSFSDFLDDSQEDYDMRYHILSLINFEFDYDYNPRGRIEVRAFKSTTNVDTIYAYLDFIYTLIDGCNKECDLDCLVNYVLDNNQGYLNRYIAKRKAAGKWLGDDEDDDINQSEDSVNIND